MIEHPVHTIEALPVTVRSTLYGRDQQRQQLEAVLESTGVVWLYGTPGIGRRALAAHLAAERVTQQGGVLWFQAYHDDILMLASRVSRAYSVAALSTDDVGTQIEMARALLQQNQPLLVIEGPVAPGILAQFVQLSVPPDVPVILIAHTPVDGPWQRIGLSPLLDRDAEMVYREAGHLEESRRSALLAPLINYVEGLPNSLVVAGRQSANAGITSTHLASLLPRAPAGAENRALGVYAAAHSILDSASQGLFLLLGALFVDRIGLQLLQGVSRVPEETLVRLLDILVDRGLVDVYPVGGQSRRLYRVHDLARIYARRRLQSAGQLGATRQRILEGIVRFLEDFTQQANETSFDALVLEMVHFLGAARYCLSQNDVDTLRRIFMLLGKHGNQNIIHARGYIPFYDRLGRMLSGKPEEPEPLFRRLIQRVPPSASQTPDELAAADTASFTPPDTQQVVAMSREALQETIASARQAGNNAEVARLLVALADWYTRYQRYDQALEHYQEAFGYFDVQPAEDERLLPLLNKLAASLLQLGQAEDAMPYINRGLAVADELGYQDIKGILMVALGDAQLQRGDDVRALSAYQQAAELLEADGDLVNTGLALGKAANILLDQGEFQEATVVLAQVAALFDRAGRRDLQGQALGNLGTAFGHMG
ncbi:MAG: hypothetical protein GYB66_00750, partial [Chloroflexi bacterium]|nr:hypothetical protein [Chloroflexota bacterium]